MLQNERRKRRIAIDELGDAHELTFSCYRRTRLLDLHESKTAFLRFLEQARRQYDFEIWAYVVMPEHIHLVVFPKLESCKVRHILRGVKQGFAQWLVAQLKRTDPGTLRRLEVRGAMGAARHRVWQRGGGYDRNLYTPKVIWNSIDYLHENPVRRGLVEQPVDWPYSSARNCAGLGDVLMEVDQCDVWS